MTPEQMAEFCKQAQFGVAVGLNHRYEWYVNASRALMHGRYEEIPQRQAAIDDAFVAFEKGTVSCPEEEAELEALTVDQYVQKVNDWYSNA